MEEQRCVVFANYDRGCSPECGWEAKTEWEAKRLVEWLGENGVRAKQVGKSYFAD